jgi:hypothetical protein
LELARFKLRLDLRELTLLRRENGVPVENLLAIVLKADSYFAKWRHSVKVTTLLDQGNIALITSGFTLHHTVLLYLFTDVLIFCVSSNLH